MKWINGETWESRIERKEQWHKWFAWFPVTVDLRTMPDGKVRNVKVWWEWVERKGKYHFWPGDSYWTWEYRQGGRP